MNQSPHQLVYNLYNIIALTEIKGYAMLQFSYMMLRIYESLFRIMGSCLSPWVPLLPDFRILRIRKIPFRIRTIWLGRIAYKYLDADRVEKKNINVVYPSQ